MLEFFRQHIGGGLVGVLLVGLLAVAFAFSFGAQSKGWGEGQSEQMAAVADGYDIPEMTLDYAYSLLGGRGLNPNEGEGASLKLSALEGLIERSLLLALADQIGITASSEDAVERIVKSKLYLSRPIIALSERMEAYPFFDPKDAATLLVSEGHRIPQSFENDEGVFNVEFYKSFIKNQLRQTEEDFVEQQRLEIVAERMRQLIVSAVRISEEEVRTEYNRVNDTATIQYIRFIPAFFADQLKPTKEELKAWAVAHADEIKQHYEKNQFRYTDIEEQVRARHILIKYEENASAEVKQAAKAKIDALLVRAKAGESFEALATEASEDEGSAKKGGDLGYTPRGRMVPEFDKVMFDTKPGEISDVVETKYGYHIIKVEGVRKGNVPLAEATPEIADELYREANGKTAAKAKADELLNRIKAGEKLASLAPKEEEMEEGPRGLKVNTSRAFDKSATSIPGIGEAKEMVEAAFSGKDPDKLFELRGDYYLMALGERKEPNDADFKTQKEALTEKLLSMKQALWLKSQIKSLKEKAEKEGRIKIVYAPPAPAASSEDKESDLPGKKEKAGNKKADDKKAGKADVDKSAPKAAVPPPPTPPANTQRTGDDGEQDDVE